MKTTDGRRGSGRRDQPKECRRPAAVKLYCPANMLSSHSRGFSLDSGRAFELEPEIKAVFQLSDIDDVKAHPKFLSHARAMVDMTDCAVSFLGPDLDPLAEDLMDLGKRHASYGVQPDHLPVMEKSIMYAIEELVGNKVTREDRNSWQTVFHYLITHMRKGMKN